MFCWDGFQHSAVRSSRRYLFSGRLSLFEVEDPAASQGGRIERSLFHESKSIRRHPDL